MLVITRRVNESIEIGEDITIMVTHLDNRQCRLGIDAPSELMVVRTEIKEKYPDKLAAGRDGYVEWLEARLSDLKQAG